MTAILSDRFVRTKAGKTEIQAKSHQMSRPARNLLMMIDSSWSGLEWVAKVNGCTQDDFRQLMSFGLIECTTSVDSVAMRAQVPIESALRKWTYDALYTLLTHEARERFGLIKGFRLILKIEGCSDLKGLQTVALEFVSMVRKSHGEESAARFRKQLGASD